MATQYVGPAGSGPYDLVTKAQLDAATTPPTIEELPPGVMVACNESGGAYTRPTDRTDIVVVFTGADDPGAVALENDRWERLA